MRVLINALSARRGGGQTYLANILRHKDSRDGLQLYVICDDSLALPADRHDIRRVGVGWQTRNPLVRAVWEYLLLPRLLRSLEIEVLFCPGGVVSRRLPTNCMVVTMFRNMLPFDLEQCARYPLGWTRTRLWLLAKVLLRSIERADCAIFISEFGRRIIGEITAGQLARSVVISHGLDARFKTAGCKGIERPQIVGDAEYLAYVSLLDYYKNQLELVRAFALVRQNRRTIEKLLLVGPSDSVYGDDVRREVRALDLEDAVIVTGHVPHDELPALFFHAKVNIFASSCENCPNVMLEAMGSGRPLLASNRPPMPEFAADAASYMDPSSPEDIAAKVLDLIDNPSRQKLLGRKASARVAHRNWEHVAQQTWSLIAAQSHQ